MKKVDIIIRTKDRLLLLKRALDSVLAQTYDNWEIIIVNNGGHMEEIEHFMSRYSDVLKGRYKLIHTHKAVAIEAATNIGIKNGSGEYVTLLDDDDTWEKEFLSNCISVLEQKKDVYGVITRTRIIYEEIYQDSVQEVRQEVFNPTLKKISLYSIGRHNMFTTNAFVYRREVYREIGFYREDLPVLGDWEFNIRFLQKYRIEVIPKVLANYHKRISNFNNEAYDNSSLYVHRRYDKKIRKEYFIGCIKEKKIIFGVMIYVYGFVNTLKSFIKNFIRFFANIGKLLPDG